MTIALLLALGACGSDGWFGGDSSRSTSSMASAPTVPPQTGQAGQTSQQARGAIAREPGGQQALSGTMGMSTAASQLTAAERGFIIEAAQHGTAEVELGRLAEQRGSTQAVRDFGRTMVQDHTKANQELMGIAQRLGITPPTSIPPSGQAIQARLQQASGQDFDRQYLEQQAADHTAQRAMFQFTANNARNPELRGFAQRTLPVVERHLDHLRQMLPAAPRTGS
jgi:putative membrane protein